jgi:dolichol-phosphate mannosyltransferase
MEISIMEIAIIIPTYNEIKNIDLLISRLQEEIGKIEGHNIMILVVDDYSPDGTADRVRELQKTHDNLHLVSGEKQGLGVAYLRGFNHAINSLDADVVSTMDADLSHPPELISNFVKAIDEGYDLVIGSRYIEGGATPDWNLKRKMISRCANTWARLVGGFYHVHDCTSGYRAIRTDTFLKIDQKNLEIKGYAFIPTLLYELTQRGVKVKEIPLVFYDRKHGETKIKMGDMTEFFIKILKLRFKSKKG